jgi:hypothetical protein
MKKFEELEKMQQEMTQAPGPSSTAEPQATTDAAVNVGTQSETNEAAVDVIKVEGVENGSDLTLPMTESVNQGAEI